MQPRHLIACSGLATLLAIQAFLACAINHAFSTAAYLVEQLVVAEFHLHSALFLRVIFLVIERAQPSPKQTHAAKSAGRVGKNRRAAFCANPGGVCHCGFSCCLCTARNSFPGYACNTEIKCRSSSSTSPGTATVWAISSRNNCRYRCRKR